MTGTQKGRKNMNEKDKQEWKLEQTQPEKVPQEPESSVDKERLADYVLERLPVQAVKMLEKGASIRQVMAEIENQNLKKENASLKAQLAEKTKEPLTLASEGGEREKDPFAAGFMQALAEF